MNQTLLRIAELQRRGLSAEQIADRLGVSADWVSAVTGTDAFGYVRGNCDGNAQDRGEEDGEGGEGA